MPWFNSLLHRIYTTGMGLYNNAIVFGKMKMRLEAVLVCVAALVMVGAGIYAATKPNDHPFNDGQKGAKVGALLGIGALCAVLSWAVYSMSYRNNSTSRLMAASSTADFFVSPLLSRD